MKLSTKGRYAVTALADIALNGAAGPVTLADISARQGISLAYLEQLFVKLRRRGLVVSVRGPGGGYRLAQRAGRDADLGRHGGRRRAAERHGLREGATASTAAARRRRA